MVYYFMNDELYFQGKKLPPEKQYICNENLTLEGRVVVSVLGYDNNYYTLKPEQILIDNEMTHEKLKEIYGD